MKKLILAILTAAGVFAQTAAFPGSVATNTNLLIAVDNLQTSLTAPVGISDTSITVASGTGWSANMLATIQTEQMLVTAVVSNVLTVTRAYAGTAAATHANGLPVSAYIDAFHHNTVRVEVEAIEAALGANLSNIPGSSATGVSNVAYAAGGGSANAQTVTLSPAIGSYTPGLGVCWLPTAANTTTTPTLAVNGLAADPITKFGAASLAANDLTVTAVACVKYLAGNWQLQNPQTSTGGGGGGASSFFTVSATSTTLSVISSGQPFGCNGQSTVVPAGTTTAVRLAGSTSETLSVKINCSTGHLELISNTNTLTCTVSGFSGCDSGSSYTGDIILAQVAMSSGGSSWTFGAVTNMFSGAQAFPATAGDCQNITQAGATVTFAMSPGCAVRPMGFAWGSTAAGAPTLLSDTAYFTVPYACTISAWNINVAPSGTATFDIWVIPPGTAIPTVSNSITASALPAIASGTALHSTTLTGWTTAVAANSNVALQLKIVATATYASLVVECDQ